jgi:hypothetical protein
MSISLEPSTSSPFSSNFRRRRDETHSRLKSLSSDSPAEADLFLQKVRASMSSFMMGADSVIFSHPVEDITDVGFEAKKSIAASLSNAQFFASARGIKSARLVVVYVSPLVHNPTEAFKSRLS